MLYENKAKLVRTIAVVEMMIVCLGMGIGLYRNMKDNTKTMKSEGTVIECAKTTNNTIWSFIGFVDSTEYKTLIKVDNNILESSNKEIYYLCKDKVNSNINVELSIYKGEPINVKNVME